MPGERVPRQAPAARGWTYVRTQNAAPSAHTRRRTRRLGCMGGADASGSPSVALGVRTEGRRVGAYSCERAVMVAIVEGTLPPKRLDPRNLCVSQRAVAGWYLECCTGTRAWGVQPFQPGQCRDRCREGPDEGIPLQVPARGRSPALPTAYAHSHAIASGTHFNHEEGAISAYRDTRLVSTETVEGTLPLKRLLSRYLCHSEPSQDNSRSWCCMGNTSKAVQSTP